MRPVRVNQKSEVSGQKKQNNELKDTMKLQSWWELQSQVMIICGFHTFDPSL